VLKSSSSTTRVRVIFDASAKKNQARGPQYKNIFFNDYMIQNAYICHDSRYREDVSPDQNEHDIPISNEFCGEKIRSNH
jgi:hypothetical protein